MAIQIQLRNDTAANWTTANPVLAVGELGLESDTGNYKIGDGVTAWSTLAYGGVDGASAYDIAVQNGFVGDEAAWLASLVGANGADGVGVPAGGTAGQVLSKVDGNDYNTAWIDPAGGGSADVLSVSIFNNSSTAAIQPGDVVVVDNNSGNGSHYIGFKMPNDGSGNNYPATQILGIAMDDIATDFGEGRVAIAGTFAIPYGKVTWNGELYIDSQNGALSPGPSGNPLWNTPIGRATTNGTDTVLLTVERYYNTERLDRLGDVNINYGTVADGQVLTFNGQNYQFELREAGGGGSAVNDNYILNGGFDIWQEINEYYGGTTKSTSPGSYYFADNWKSNQFGGTGTMEQERIIVRNAIGQEALTEYGLQTTVTADAGGFEFQTFIEDVNTLQGEDVTISAWVKRSAGGFVVNINDQNFGTGGSATENVFGPGATLNANEWTKLTGTFTMPETHTKNMQAGHHIAVKFNFQGLQPSEVVSIAQVKLERGTTATRFKSMYSTKAQELLACQRYYYRINQENTYEILSSDGYFKGDNSRQANFMFYFPTKMRSFPTFSHNFETATTNVMINVLEHPSGYISYPLNVSAFNQGSSLFRQSTQFAWVRWSHSTSLVSTYDEHGVHMLTSSTLNGAYIEFSARY